MTTSRLYEENLHDLNGDANGPGDYIRLLRPKHIPEVKLRHELRLPSDVRWLVGVEIILTCSSAVFRCLIIQLGRLDLAVELASPSTRCILPSEPLDIT